jgi:hypothetical protein
MGIAIAANKTGIAITELNSSKGIAINRNMHVSRHNSAPVRQSLTWIHPAERPQYRSH